MFLQLAGRIVNHLGEEIKERKDQEIIGEEGEYDVIYVSTLLEAAGVNISKNSSCLLCIWMIFLFICFLNRH